MALAGIDVRTQLLPDQLTLPLLWLGLLLSLFPLFVGPGASIVGAAVGYLSLWSIYWLFKLITGKEGMGYGDFKFLAALGAWMGASALLPIVLLSSLIGAIVGGAFLAIRGHDRATPIPFGPFIAAAGWAWFVWGPVPASLSLYQLFAPRARSARCYPSINMSSVPRERSAFAVALTGGIASGKSAVARHFEQAGVPLFDADRVAHSLVQTGQAALHEISSVFGNRVLTPVRRTRSKTHARHCFRRCASTPETGSDSASENSRSPGRTSGEVRVAVLRVGDSAICRVPAKTICGSIACWSPTFRAAYRSIV